MHRLWKDRFVRPGEAPGERFSTWRAAPATSPFRMHKHGRQVTVSDINQKCWASGIERAHEKARLTA
jgi:demethylmenaquinone methyltransferase/2-methoxy-6-polyprenyl-1,4-benzoquinol methylase